MKRDGDRLAVTVDRAKEVGASTSGTSITIASTEGNVPVPYREEIAIVVKVYRKK